MASWTVAELQRCNWQFKLLVQSTKKKNNEKDEVIKLVKFHRNANEFEVFFFRPCWLHLRMAVRHLWSGWCSSARGCTAGVGGGGWISCPGLRGGFWSALFERAPSEAPGSECAWRPRVKQLESFCAFQSLGVVPRSDTICIEWNVFFFFLWNCPASSKLCRWVLFSGHPTIQPSAPHRFRRFRNRPVSEFVEIARLFFF